MNTGAYYKGDGRCDFTVWAPLVKSVSLKLFTSPEKTVPMIQDDAGYWKASIDGVSPGTRYMYRIDDRIERADPASFYQPEGVHEPSEVIDHHVFQWEDSAWEGIPLSGMIMYELHTGTFTDEGTFDAVAGKLDYLKDVGINAVEIMPVAQFPGERNWGYDGTYPFAVQNSYGGPDGLKRLVNECHKKGIAVILDVVYNHLGPDGNYLRDYGPYFTDRYKTPWGEAVNFDGPYSNGVREYFIENALYWFNHFHIDALRLDAIHGIFDINARHFLLELSERTREFSGHTGRTFYLIAESDLNNPLVAKPEAGGGFGIHALWCDDFHHAAHALLTGERDGYYADFGKTEHLIKSLREGYVYSGQYSEFRKRNHGNSSRDIPGDRFVVFTQNHDQVGNRMNGERLSGITSFEAQKLAAGAVLLAPYIPLLFMGEEYGETAPFLYFVSHLDAQLIENIRQGRKREFESFSWKGEPPDPQDEETFMRSKLQWDTHRRGNHGILLNLYKALIHARKNVPALSYPTKDGLDVTADEDNDVVLIRRWRDNSHALALLNFHKNDVSTRIACSGVKWIKLLDSAEGKWNGPGALLPPSVEQDETVGLRAESFALYVSAPETGEYELPR